MLDNTDKALSDILTKLAEFSTQYQSDAFSSLSNVAMLSAQGDLMTANVLLWIAGVLFFLGLIPFLVALFDRGADGIVGAGIFLFAISIILSVIGLTTIYSPLDNAKARDGKIALAHELLLKIR